MSTAVEAVAVWSRIDSLFTREAVYRALFNGYLNASDSIQLARSVAIALSASSEQRGSAVHSIQLAAPKRGSVAVAYLRAASSAVVQPRMVPPLVLALAALSADACREDLYRRLTSCVLSNTQSQLGEELVVLPTLLRATRGRPGVFVEIGAFRGIALSNTLALEKCFNWRGLLIEANPSNFAWLVKSGRHRSRFVHSAVCPHGQNVTRITAAGGTVSGEEGSMPREHLRRHGRYNGAAKGNFVDVPCAPLQKILADAGYSGADFLSLDVEGAEERVFATVNPLSVAVVMVESDGLDAAKDNRVLERGLQAGLRLSQRVRVRGSDILLRPNVTEVLVHDIPHGYFGSLDNYTIFRFAPPAQRLCEEIANALRDLDDSTRAAMQPEQCSGRHCHHQGGY